MAQKSVFLHVYVFCIGRNNCGQQRNSVFAKPFARCCWRLNVLALIYRCVVQRTRRSRQHNQQQQRRPRQKQKACQKEVAHVCHVLPVAHVALDYWLAFYCAETESQFDMDRIKMTGVFFYLREPSMMSRLRVERMTFVLTLRWALLTQ